MHLDEASAEKALTVENVLEIAIQGAIIVSDPEVPVVLGGTVHPLWSLRALQSRL